MLSQWKLQSRATISLGIPLCRRKMPKQCIFHDRTIWCHFRFSAVNRRNPWKYAYILTQRCICQRMAWSQFRSISGLRLRVSKLNLHLNNHNHIKKTDGFCRRKSWILTYELLFGVKIIASGLARFLSYAMSLGMWKGENTVQLWKTEAPRDRNHT